MTSRWKLGCENRCRTRVIFPWRFETFRSDRTSARRAERKVASLMAGWKIEGEIKTGGGRRARQNREALVRCYVVARDGEKKRERERERETRATLVHDDAAENERGRVLLSLRKKIFVDARILLFSVFLPPFPLCLSLSLSRSLARKTAESDSRKDPQEQRRKKSNVTIVGLAAQEAKRSNSSISRRMIARSCKYKMYATKCGDIGDYLYGFTLGLINWVSPWLV